MFSGFARQTIPVNLMTVPALKGFNTDHISLLKQGIYKLKVRVYSKLLVYERLYAQLDQPPKVCFEIIAVEVYGLLYNTACSL